MNTQIAKIIGRNDPCYCGSGNKYKSCCLMKTHDPWIDIGGYQNTVAMAGKVPKHLFHEMRTKVIDGINCLEPNCKGKAINSHLIPKNYLKKYFSTGHCFVPDFSNLQNVLVGDIEKISLNKAHTLPLWCAIHDASIFHKIDTVKTIEINNEQRLLFFYKTIAHEYRKKQIGLRLQFSIQHDMLEDMFYGTYLGYRDTWRLLQEFSPSIQSPLIKEFRYEINSQNFLFLQGIHSPTGINDLINPNIDIRPIVVILGPSDQPDKSFVRFLIRERDSQEYRKSFFNKIDRGALNIYQFLNNFENIIS